MKNIFLLIYFVIISFDISAQTITTSTGEKFARRILTEKMQDPWEITYGPDNMLWVTEAKTYKVWLVNPATGEKTLLADLNKYQKFPSAGTKGLPGARLMGMAIHPKLLKGKPYVYLAYIKEAKGCGVNKSGCIAVTTIARYTYHSAKQTLSDPVIICDTIPGSNDHNGGRLLIAPAGNKMYLYYSVGDMGAGQFDNGGRTNHAQQVSSYEGKILRFNLEPDNDKGRNRWIPDNNPFNTKTLQSAVFTTGHRNPQGIAYALTGSTGKLYSSEHGPYSDDEVNVIEAGKNYGHPLIIGYADGNYDSLAAGVSSDTVLPGRWRTTYPTIINEKENARKIGTSFRPPIFSLYPSSHSFLSQLYNDIFSGGKDNTWPSEAPSSIDVYTASAIPGWKNSLLLTTLKGGKLTRLQLNNTGEKVIGDTISYFKSNNRFRDLAISPNGRKLYLITDSSGVTSGPSKENPQQTSCKGCIIEYTYIDDQPVAAPPRKKMH